MTTAPAAREITMIAAMDLDGVIGRGGALPWRLPDDLRRFKRLSLGKPVILGRRTHESIGRALPERLNIVLTSHESAVAPGCVCAASPAQALAAAGAAPEVIIAGGARVYEAFMALATRLELTRVEAHVGGDVYFPPLAPGAWREVARHPHPADERHAYAFTFLTLRRAGSHATQA